MREGDNDPAFFDEDLLLSSAVINVGNVSAAALSQAILNSYNTGTSTPLENFLDQFPANFTGTSGTNIIGGGGNNDILRGLEGNDALSGGAGNDILDGGPGTDLLEGGEGSDFFLPGPPGPDGGDTVSDKGTNPNDIDTLSYANSPSGLTIDLNIQDGNQSTGFAAGVITSGIERVIGSNFDDVIYGEDVGLSLADASDILEGGLGDDILVGFSGSDILQGGPGFDLLVGGPNGLFTFTGPGDVARFNASSSEIDVFYSGDGRVFVAAPGGGLDELREMEFIGLTNGTFAINAFQPSQMQLVAASAGAGGQTLNGGGQNDLILGRSGNDTLNGNAGADKLRGGEGNDVLAGGSENDELEGESGNDVLNGGTGIDVMIGGAGNDTYIVDNVGDSVVELAGGGLDLVRTAVSFMLSNNVENGELLGSGNINATGNTLANTLIGNAGNNVLNGRQGADRMFGNDGNDTYIIDVTGDVVGEIAGNGTDLVRTAVSYTLSANIENGELLGASNTFLAGNELANTLIGNSGDNVLNGRAGADRMFGNGGNDTYVVDNAGDLIGEVAGNGTDLVRAFVSHTLSANVENVILEGAANIFAAGNGLENTLVGNAGNNTLNGRGGDDRMFGGAGNDTYVIDSAGDVVGEVAGNGIDTILSVVSRVTDAEVERLTLIGNGNINGVGNGLANVILGNGGANTILGGSGNDTIKGGGGLDTLTGGLGSDTFVFSAASESGPANLQRDRITDFNSAENDRIFLASIDANTGVGGNQAFALDTNGSFSAGEIRQTQFGSNLLLEMNTDADAAAEMSILLLNSGLLDAGDFVL